jgi:hypothetical protein
MTKDPQRRLDLEKRWFDAPDLGRSSPPMGRRVSETCARRFSVHAGAFRKWVIFRQIPKTVE